MIGLIKGTARQAKTVSGLPLPIASYKSNSKSPIQELSLSINPVQDLHGYDSPWAGGAGKNILDGIAPYTVNAGSTSYPLIGTCELQANTTYTLSCKQTGTPSTVARNRFAIGKTNNIWDANNTVYGQDALIIPSFSFTPTETQTYYIFIWTQKTDANLTYSEFQLEAGSSATSYAPYENICPITGVSSVNVENWGKYIRALPATAQSVTNNGITFTIKSNGQVDINGTATALASVTIPVKPFTVFSEDGRTIRLHNTFISPLSNVIFNNGTTTIDSWSLGVLDRTYSNFSNLAGKYVDTIQITIPSGATINGSLMVDFNVSGTGNTYIIALGDTYYGATLDVVRGKLRVTHKFLSFDYSSPWYGEALGAGIGYNFYTSCGADVKALQYGDDFICNVSKTSTSGSSQKDRCFISNGKNFNFAWGATLDIYSVSDFTTFLQNNNVTIQITALLATPIEIDLTPTQINSLLGSNNVWHDGNGDVEVLKFMDRQLYFGR